MNHKRCCLCISILSVISGLCLIFSWPIIFDCALSLECNIILSQTWQNIPFPIRTEFFLFNWTNPEDIYNISIKPKFEEIGPFVFEQFEEKSNVVWNDNGTVTFQLKRYWYHKDEGRNLEDKIINVDPFVPIVSYATRFWNTYIRKIILSTFSTSFQKVYATYTANELLFDGHPLTLMKIATKMPFFSLTDFPPWDKFGWLYSRNGTTWADGVSNIGTGKNSVLGQMYNWDYQSETEYFEDDCNKVSGFSQFFGRNLKRDTIALFSTDLKRPISLKYEGEKDVNGILGYNYGGGDFIFDNGTRNPQNKCFCNGECLPSGLNNISSTRYNTPIFVSLPHLYGADPYYFNLVDGLKPDKEKHDFVATIEPNTGFVLDASPKLQINFLLKASGDSNLLESRTIVFPMIWTRQTTEIPLYFKILLKLLLLLPSISIILGLGLVLFGLFCLLYEGLRDDKRRNEEDEIFEENSLKLLGLDKKS